MGDKPASVQSAFNIDRSEYFLDGASFRPWEEEGGIPSSKKVPHRSRKVASATVEVVESVEMDQQRQFLDFKARLAPQLHPAFAVGHELRFNRQLLREFMAQDPSHPHPISVPSFFYSNFKPPPKDPSRVDRRGR